MVDAYIADLKFGDESCARRLAGTSPYLPIVLDNITTAAQDYGALLVIRHVVMPGHLDCCTHNALAALAQRVSGAWINLLPYLPLARGPEYGLDRVPTSSEMAWAGQLAKALGFRIWDAAAQPGNAACV